ncbi:hypothetical protein LTR42_001463 [Elasticomyces elasticus]|nr:hypothetical protein LTR42_001463 [Elasticomyces elasticus]
MHTRASQHPYSQHVDIWTVSITLLYATPLTSNAANKDEAGLPTLYRSTTVPIQKTILEMPRNLTINPAAPYKSSKLAVPTSPFTPRLPITPTRPIRARSSSSSSRREPAFEHPPPPASPLRWLWQCHLCNRVYQLGTTRRCLDDGHYFCAGTTTVKRSRRTNKKTVRHKACASEFDYQGWKTWGTWRRSVAELREAASSDAEDEVVLPLRIPTVPKEGEWLNGMWAKTSASRNPAPNFWGKDCWASVTIRLSVVGASNMGEKRKTTFDDILLDASDASNSTADHLEHAREPETTTAATNTDSKETEKKPNMTDLLESAKRRKRRSGGQLPSPLGSNPPSPTTTEAPKSFAVDESASMNLQKAFDDFEIELRKASLLERAGGLVSSWATSIRSTAALEEEKAELFVKGLRISKAKK